MEEEEEEADGGVSSMGADGVYHSLAVAVGEVEEADRVMTRTQGAVVGHWQLEAAVAEVCPPMTLGSLDQSLSLNHCLRV